MKLTSRTFGVLVRIFLPAFASKTIFVIVQFMNITEAQPDAIVHAKLSGSVRIESGAIIQIGKALAWGARHFGLFGRNLGSLYIFSQHGQLG